MTDDSNSFETPFEVVSATLVCISLVAFFVAAVVAIRPDPGMTALAGAIALLAGLVILAADLYRRDELFEEDLRAVDEWERENL